MTNNKSRAKPSGSAQKITFSVQLPVDLVQWLDDRSKKENRSRSNMTAVLLERARREA